MLQNSNMFLWKFDRMITGKYANVIVSMKKNKTVPFHDWMTTWFTYIIKYASDIHIDIDSNLNLPTMQDVGMKQVE